MQVQLLVDCLLSFAPFALYPKLGVLTALLCPVLTLSTWLGLRQTLTLMSADRAALPGMHSPGVCVA